MVIIEFESKVMDLVEYSWTAVGGNAVWLEGSWVSANASVFDNDANSGIVGDFVD